MVHFSQSYATVEKIFCKFSLRSFIMLSGYFISPNPIYLHTWGAYICTLIINLFVLSNDKTSIYIIIKVIIATLVAFFLWLNFTNDKTNPFSLQQRFYVEHFNTLVKIIIIKAWRTCLFNERKFFGLYARSVLMTLAAVSFPCFLVNEPLNLRFLFEKKVNAKR